MRFNFRKIASVLASATMVSSTVALAAAANYPAPFVQGGNADVAVVYGSTAQATDLVAVADITSNLQAKLAAQTATSDGTTSGATVTGGDSFEFSKSSTKLNLGRGLTDVVSVSITDSDMPNLLADGKYIDDDNDEFDFTQKIEMSNLSYGLFDDNDYKADTPTVGIRIANGDAVLNYTIDFTDEPVFTDLETTDISLMGKAYYILDVNTPTNTSITLLDSASDTVLAEGETTTLTSGDTDYEVGINFVSSTEVILEVNGELTNSLSEGATQKLNDGSYVGIKDILYSSKDTGVSKVEFSIGSGKLELTDGSDIEINDEAVTDLVAHVNGNSAGDKLSDIIIEWRAEDDLFITEDSEIVMPGFGSVKLSYAGIIVPKEESISVEPDGDSSFVLKGFPLKNSEEDISLLYWNGTAFTLMGKDADEQLRTTNESTMTFDGDTDAYFVASWNDGSDAESHLMRATNFKVESSVNKTTFQYKSGGTWTNVASDVRKDDTVSIGNVELTIGYIDKDAKTVAITGGSNVEFNTLYSKEGMKVWLPWNATSEAANEHAAANGLPGHLNISSPSGNNTWPTTFSLTFSEEDRNGNIAAGSNVTVTLQDNSNDETTVGSVSGYNSGRHEVGDSDVFRSFVYSPLGTEISEDTGGDQDSVVLTYHGGETYGQVFLTSAGATVSGGTGSGGSGTVTELGSVSVSDSEASSVSDKNLIVVGGSCVNTVAASLLGSSSPLCGAAWEAETGVGAGSFLIETFDRGNGKVATLVAGYNAGDTTNAAKALTTQTVDTSVGKKYTGSSSTSISLATTESSDNSTA